MLSETHKVGKKMNKSYKRAMFLLNTSDLSEYKQDMFKPKVTSSPSKKASSLNQLNNMSKVSNGRFRNVEKCRGSSRNTFSNIKKQFSNDVIFICNESLPTNQQLLENDIEFDAQASKKQANLNKLQKFHFEAGLKARLNNQKKNKQKTSNSYISTILNIDNSLSINKSEIKDSVENQSCCTCSFESSSFTKNLSTSGAHSSFSTENYSSLSTPLVFDVKMASTPKSNKKQLFSTIKTSTLAKTQSQQQKLQQVHNHSFCKHCVKQNDLLLMKMKKKSSSSSKEKHQKVTSSIETEKLMTCFSYKTKRSNARIESNKEILKQQQNICGQVVKSAESLHFNTYLKKVLKNSNKISKRSMNEINKIQVKRLRSNNLNVSTSTKKVYLTENMKTTTTTTSTSTSSRRSKSMKKQLEYQCLFNEPCEQMKSKKLKLDLDVHLQNNDPFDNFNNYYQNTCLNKFNQLGQLQVWYV